MPVPVSQYPANLILTGKPVLVVGAGRIAARKARALLEAGAVVSMVAPEVSAQAEELAREVGGTIQRRRYRAEDLSGMWLAVAATGDSQVNAGIAQDCEEARVWLNSADDPDNCSFTLPAVARQGPVMVTVATGGHSPALASWLKGHVADEMGPEYGILAGMLSDAREQVKASGRSTEEIDWASVIDWSLLRMIAQGHTDQARRRLNSCLS